MELFQQVVQVAPDAVVIVRKDGTIVLLNEQTEVLFGYEHDELIGQCVEVLLPQRFRSTHVEQRIDYFVNPRVRRMGSDLKMLGRRKDGSEFPVEISLSPLDTNVGPMAIACIRDGTERQRADQEKLVLEERLRESHKLQARGTLASGIAHDFNNLMTAIRGFADLAGRSLPSNHESRSSLLMIGKVIEQADVITQSLLTFAQKTPGKKMPIELTQIVRESVRLLRRLFPAAITLEEHMPAHLEVWTYADPAQIQQVLINLAINARDAMPEGGQLRVSVRVDATRESDSSDITSEAVLTVEDTGSGMSKETQARIFEPFFTTKAREKGTGLGLSMVHGIVADHGGRIEVESQPAQGTRFTIRLPICGAPLPASAEPAAPQHALANGELILLAEDDEYVRKVMLTCLESGGYRVIGVADGEEVNRVIGAQEAAMKLIVLDLDLPKKSGMSCLEEIRRSQAHLPVVLVTGAVDRFLDERRPDKERLLRKPFKMSELVGVVGQMLNDAASKES